MIRPVGHFLHGFHFRATSSRSVDPVVKLFQPLFVPRVQIPFGDMSEFYLHMDRREYPHLFAHPLSVRAWQPDDPGVEQLLLHELAGDRVASVLRIDTPDKFLVWAEHHSHSLELRMLTHALAGRRARAVLLAAREIGDYRDRGVADRPWFANRIRRLRRLIRIFESGQTRTNRLLRTFERISARNIGIEAWWRWSPVVE